MDRAHKFRRAASQENQGRSKAGWRYSAELKSLAVPYCREQREIGCTWAEISDQLNVSPLTLSRWLEAASTGSFRPVTVVEPAPNPEQMGESCLTAVTSGGLRIEGLSWLQVLELAKVLS